mmetsp:Transcript_117976/g.251974  ORF Transcript_117976/g.251974 Transcript_117976/m.251974 type:complete len:245 (-) Transcript_117976:107-841(-)
MNSHEGDEDEELVPRQRVFMGMKFHDEESQSTARRVSVASLILGCLVVVHFILHMAKKGKFGSGIGHLILGLVLPAIGYRSATLHDASPWRPRLLWMFHIGNVVFVLVHTVVLLVVCLQVLELESASVETMCDWSRQNDPWLRPAMQNGPKVLPTMPPARDSYADCVRAVQEEKSHAPGLMMLWAILSLPYWGCAAYAAYYSHELYFQLRIRELSVHRDGRGSDTEHGEHERLATVGWSEAAVE